MAFDDILTGADSGKGISEGLKNVSGKTSALPLIGIGAQLFNEGTPNRQAILGQTGDLLRTGATPGSQVPVIQRAVEQQKMATSQSLRDAQDNIAGAGLSGTPWAQGIEAGITSQGNAAQADAATQVGQNFLQMGSNLTSQLPGLAIASLGAGGQIAQGGKGAVKGK